MHARQPDADSEARLAGTLAWLPARYLAAALFLGGAYCVRAGWVEAGKASALDPMAVIASQRPAG